MSTVEMGLCKVVPETDLIIRCYDRCVFRLSYPAFFLRNPVSTAKKLFGFLFQFADEYPENQAAIRLLRDSLPNIIELEKAFVQGTAREKNPLKSEKLLKAFEAEEAKWT